MSLSFNVFHFRLFCLFNIFHADLMSSFPHPCHPHKIIPSFLSSIIEISCQTEPRNIYAVKPILTLNLVHIGLFGIWTACPRRFLSNILVCALQAVLLSDVFTDRSQFDWMLSVLLDVQKTHPAEDELVSHYVVLGLCKAGSIVGLARWILASCYSYSLVEIKSTK